MKRKLFKAISITVFVAVVIVGFYLYDLHALSVEGNKIFEQRCLVVNPPLIAYKNSFLDFVEALKNPNKYTSEEMKGFYDGYISGMRDYEPKENDWIMTQRSFIDRIDFKLIEPSYLKIAGQYQIKMYEAYRDEALVTIDVMDERITEDEYQSRFKDARDRRDKYTDLYNEVYEKPSFINDWRQRFTNVPFPPGCNESNLIIPNTTGALDPTPAPVKNPDVTG